MFAHIKIKEVKSHACQFALIPCSTIFAAALKRGMSINRAFDDPGARKANEAQQGGAADYIFNRSAVMRGHHCYAGAAGRVCQFYGPLDNVTYGKQVTRDSFLSGRGQALSNAPESEVRWLPEDLFAPMATMPISERANELPLTQTRQSRACNSVTNVDISQYSLMPSGYQDDFTGLRVELQGERSRDVSRQEELSKTAFARAAQKNKSSYGWYPPTSVVRRR